MKTSFICTCNSKNKVTFDKLSAHARCKERNRAKKAHEDKLEIQKNILTSRYFTSGHRITDETQRDLFNEPENFKYPDDLELFATKILTQAWRKNQSKQQLHLKCNKKSNLKTELKKDLYNRLYVKDPPKAELTFINDIAPTFYDDAANRPIKDVKNVKAHIQTCRDVLMTRIVTGFRHDDIKYLEERIQIEQEVFENTASMFKKYSLAFGKFLTEDHQLSIDLVRNANDAKNLTWAKEEEFEALSREYNALIAEFYKTEKFWRNLKLYQKFLYLLSPLQWRKENNISFTIEFVGDIFKEFKEIDEYEDLSILINRFSQAVENEEEYLLYFTDPKELIRVSQHTNIRILETILDMTKLSTELESIQAATEYAKSMFERDAGIIEYQIEKLSKDVIWEEERAKYLQETAYDVLETQFREVIASDSILNLYALLEDTYERTIGSNKMKHRVEKLMEALEISFLEDLHLLDMIAPHILKKVEANYYIETIRRMLKAEKADKLIRQYDILCEKIRKALEEPFQKTGRELKFRSRPIDSPKPKRPPPRQLTSDEKDYLIFFTTYCEDIDQLEDFGINLNEPPKVHLPWMEEDDESF